mgnify:CR=1 FL=1
MKSIIKKILSYLGLFNKAARAYYLVKTYGFLIGIYHFILIDNIKILTNRTFDYMNHIDTTGITEVQDLDIREKDFDDANRYQPVSIHHLKISLKYLLSYNKGKYDFFLDIGCGKGRPSFFATRYHPQINKFVGIDISNNLINLANKNLSKFKNKNNVPTRNILFKKINALHFKLLKNKSYIIFLFNPFSEKYLDLFLKKNLNLIKVSNSRIIYVNQPSSSYFKKNFKLIFYDRKIKLFIYK